MLLSWVLQLQAGQCLQIVFSSRIHFKILRQNIIPIIIIMYYEYISIFESFKFLNCGKKRKLGILRNGRKLWLTEPSRHHDYRKGKFYQDIQPLGWFIPKACTPRPFPNPDFMDFLSPFDWEIRKRICTTILVNSGLPFSKYAYACKTAVLKDSFSNPFSDFPTERYKWKSKNRYLSVEIRFRISRSIANPKSGF